VIEKLLPIELPPGLHNNGTTFQAKDRWVKANLVRFYQGNKQPIGGWVQRTLSGAAILGTPNAAVSWQLNDGNSYLAIGTTTNLYIVTSGNVVYDITPATVAGDGITHIWQLESFGAYLLATFQRPVYLDSNVINVFTWTGTLANLAVAAYDYTTGPGSAYGITTTPERFLVVLRGADPAAWSPTVKAGAGGTSGGSGGVDGSGGVGGGGGGGTAPTAVPVAPTLTSATHGPTVIVTATWTNNDHTASIRVAFERSTAGSGGPFTSDGTYEDSPETVSQNYSHSTGIWVRSRLQYFNATGSGPWGAYSSVLAI
jgi:hypothetical protein